MSEPSSETFRLHIGGKQVKPGWKILDIREGDEVDFVGDCMDLSRFADNSIDEIYASHVYEHLSYVHELPRAMAELHRVLKPGGKAYISVPDLQKLCQLFLRDDLDGNQRFLIMRMMFGGHAHEYDFHKVGLTLEFMLHILSSAKFSQAQHVPAFGMFDDASTIRFAGELISLNVIAIK